MRRAGGVALLACGATAAVVAAFGADTFVAAWTVQFASMAAMSALLAATRPALRGPWYRVRSWEPALHRRLGVWRYQRLLRAVGWERLNRRFDGSRASLAAFERATRESEFAHVVLAVLSAALAAGATASRAWHAAVWLLALTVPLHVYPVLLQRAVRQRINRLLPLG